MPEGRLQVIRSDGSAALTCLDGFPRVGGMAWSPDGDRLLVWLTEPSSDDSAQPGPYRQAVYVLDAERDPITRLFAVLYSDVEYYQPFIPSWTADSQHILYEDANTLIVKSLDGGTVREVKVGLISAHYTPFLWTPDGRLMYNELGKDLITIDNLATGSKLDIPFSGGYISYTEWSPDGDHALVCVRSDADAPDMQVWLLSLCRQSIEMVAENVQLATPDDDPITGESRNRPLWSPDGTSVLFLSDGVLYWLNAAEGSITDAGFPPLSEDSPASYSIRWSESAAFVVWGETIYVYDLVADQLAAPPAEIAPRALGGSFEYFEVSADGRYALYSPAYYCGTFTCLSFRVQDWRAGTTALVPPNSLNMPNPLIATGPMIWHPSEDWALVAEYSTFGAGYPFWGVTNAEGTVFREIPAPHWLPDYVDTRSFPRTSRSVRPSPLARLFGTDWIGSVAWSPDGSQIAGASAGAVNYDGRVRVWDANTGQVVRDRDHEGCAIRSGDMWAKPAPQLTKNIGHQKVVWSADGTTLGILRVDCGHPRDAEIWDVASGETLALYDDTSALVFSPDGIYLALAHYDGRVVLLDQASGAIIREIGQFPDTAYQLAFSADGSRLLASTAVYNNSEAGVVQVWDVVSGETVFSLDAGSGVNGTSLSPDGRWVAVTTNYFGGDPYLKVFDIATNEVLLDSDTQDGPVSFSPDGRYLVSGSLVLAGTVIYDTATWQPVARHYGNGVDIAWSPDGQRYAMASSTTVTIWALPLVVGRQAAVHVVQGDTLNVREGVGLDFAILEKLPEGAVVTVLEGPREAGGNIGWRVQTAGGTEGWVVAEADNIQTLVP